MELLSILVSAAVIGGVWVTLAPTAWLQCGVGFFRTVCYPPVNDRLKSIAVAAHDD